jgi:hypothetical protein
MDHSHRVLARQCGAALCVRLIVAFSWRVASGIVSGWRLSPINCWRSAGRAEWLKRQMVVLYSARCIRYPGRCAWQECQGIAIWKS